jgi:D-xylose transport system ATP-binding protein
MADVFEVTDKIFVMRLGAGAATFDTATASREAVVAAITGATSNGHAQGAVAR